MQCFLWVTQANQKRGIQQYTQLGFSFSHEKLQKAISTGESKLKNEKFMSNAPANIVERAKAELAESVAKKGELEKLLSRLV